MAERYCGSNILICAAGELQHEEIVASISEAFQQVAAGIRRPLCSLPEYRRRISIVEKNFEQVHICLGTRALPQNHPNRFESYLLNAILGGSMSSRLFQKIREEQGLAYSIYSYLNCHSDAGALVIYAGTSPEDAPHVTGIMLKELRRYKYEAVSADELHAAREQLKGQLLLSMESTDNRMTRLAKNEIYLGRQPSTKEVLAGFDRVAAADIQKLADFILRDDYLTLQAMGRATAADFPAVDLTLG
jgi:predicted Zn-dependent peptidase